MIDECSSLHDMHDYMYVHVAACECVCSTLHNIIIVCNTVKYHMVMLCGLTQGGDKNC